MRTVDARTSPQTRRVSLGRRRTARTLCWDTERVSPPFGRSVERAARPGHGTTLMVETNRTSRIETPSGDVEYRDEGDGPCVLFVHGSPGGCDQGSLMTRFLR